MGLKRPRRAAPAYAAICSVIFAVGAAHAAEISVVSSGGFAAAYKTLAPAFEAKTGDRLVTQWGPSMGDTANAVPQRLKRGEPIDVVIMVGYALDDLIKQGKALSDGRADLAQAGIGIAVRAGAPKPDISTPDALRKTLLAAKSVAVSDSASGVYISTEMYKKLGIASEMAAKSRMIPAEPVGAVVARGEADIGFQQISELKPIAGIDIVGPLPADVQKYTVFSAGVVAASKEAAAAKALISYLASPAAASAIVASGMEPVANAANGNAPAMPAKAAAAPPK